MTEEVILTVNGSQEDIGEEAATELITAARYYWKNNKHFIIYDEPDADTGETINNQIKISEEQIDVIRRGAGNVHMTFVKDRQHMTRYETPAGNLMLDIFTNTINVEETGSKIDALVDYSLSMNDVFISRCQVHIQVLAKDQKDFHLFE